MAFPGYFDAHCHCKPGAFAGRAHFPSVAVKDGVASSTGMVCGRLLCGVHPGDWGDVEAIAAAWPGTVPAFGLHPWYASPDLMTENRNEAQDAVGAGKEQPDEKTGVTTGVTSVVPDAWEATLEHAIRSCPAAWVGEIGLDALKTERASESEQEEAFVMQLRLARCFGRAVNLHCVKAEERLLALLDKHYLADGGGRFLVHSFAGPHQYIEKFRERGAYFSVGPLVSRRDTRRGRARTALLPLDRIVLESDAFLPFGSDAEKDLAHTGVWLAELLGMDEQDCLSRMADNSKRMTEHDKS